ARGQRPTQAHVDDLGAVVGGPADGLGDPAHRAAAAGREHLEGHDGGAEGDAADPQLVVGGLGDGPGHVGAVAVVVVGVLVVGDEVVAGHELGGGQVGH